MAAQLLHRGKQLGVHFFVVQLRDEQTLLPLPGVTVGDIGPKPGAWNSIDNGFVVFDNVVLCREAMLDRFQRISPSGEYEVLVPAKTRFGKTLGALSAGRVNIVLLAAGTCRDAMLISIRYSAVRRQFGPPSKSSEEDPVLDYPLQQARLLPFLAGSYCLRFFSEWLSAQFEGCEARARQGDESKEFLALNAEIHAVSCGGKAAATWYAFRAIEESRSACGGHGFSAVSGITALRDFHDPFMTFEGDNNVLLQQLERFLLKSAQRNQFDSPMGSLAILKNALAAPGACAWRPGSNTLDIQEALNVRCSYQLRIGGESLAAKLASFDGSSGVPFKDFAWRTWNEAQPGALQGAGKAFMEALIFAKSVEACAAAPESLRGLLEQVCSLYGTQMLTEDNGPLLESGYFSAAQSAALRRQLVDLCAAIRPHALALVDGFAPPDAFVSPLAKSDGKVYKHLWEATKHRTQRVPYWQEARTPIVPMSQGNLVKKIMSKL